MNPYRSKRSIVIAAALTVGAGGILGACGDDSKSATTTTAAPTTSTTAPAAEGIEVSGAWARTSPAKVTAGAVYMVIENGGSEDDSLLEAKVDPSIAKEAQLHETKAAEGGDSQMGMSTIVADDMTTTTAAGGMMTMKEVDEIPVPAGGSVSLEPGGYHVMLMELAEPLVVGSKIEVTLTFEKAGEIVVEADVRDTAP